MEGRLISGHGTGDTTEATCVDDVVTTGGTGAIFNLAIPCGTEQHRLIRNPLDILVVHFP
eukprot:CAMPEP_0202441318 /NCGR_PEP_ID=MMETSP1360-20130828/804_1 /ASSEMBLY_ACC=CAM_ASM_000848 /TAXON_ID=515479 /ORGANISM="Licmophora paradoxa, Strain CCMP2313" /LENGTH=59 /DNA_ID=CAMNT_0049056249 /DNA_START=119 /DNA_END=294 /DNA_ORIENTATION=-